MSFDNGPGDSKFLVVGSHWKTAAPILDPDLLVWAQKVLETDKFPVSIPHRDTLLIFPAMDKKYYPEIKNFVMEKESDDKEILTFDLFELSNMGVKPPEN